MDKDPIIQKILTDFEARFLAEEKRRRIAESVYRRIGLDGVAKVAKYRIYAYMLIEVDMGGGDWLDTWIKWKEQFSDLPNFASDLKNAEQVIYTYKEYVKKGHLGLGELEQLTWKELTDLNAATRKTSAKRVVELGLHKIRERGTDGLRALFKKR